MSSYKSSKICLMLSGKQGSGKTTLSRNLYKRFVSDRVSVRVIKLAAPLYEMHDQIYKTLGRYGVLDEKVPIDGPLLQWLGTDWGRDKFGHDVWVRCFRAECAEFWSLNPNGVVICDDVRFPNELSCFEFTDVPVLKVRLECDRRLRKSRAEKWRDNEDHPSEVALDGFLDEFDLVCDTGKCTQTEVVNQCQILVRNFVEKLHKSKAKKKRQPRRRRVSL